MRSRMLLGLGVSVALGVAGAVSATAEVVPPPAGSRSAVTGWSGDDPAVVGSGEGADGRITLAFTSADTNGTRTLWVATRAPGGGWEPPTTVASGVDGSSADFAQDASGASVVAWDTRGADGQVQLMVSQRPGTDAAWTSPVALASDSGTTHQPAVGIDSSGAASIGYVHDSATGAAAFTRRYASGAWGDPVEHSSGVVRQVDLAVADHGDVTLAWSELAPDGRTGLFVQRLDEPADTWEAPASHDDDMAPEGLLDLAVDDDDLAAVVWYRQWSPDGSWAVYAAHSHDGLPGDACRPDCPTTWYENGITAFRAGDVTPEASIALDRQGRADLAVTHGFAGAHAIWVGRSNGSGWGRFTALSETPDNADPELSNLGGINVPRVLTTWIAHTPDGDVLQARAALVTDDVVPEPDITQLGPAPGSRSAVMDAEGDTTLVWPEGSGGSSTLQSATLSAEQIVDPGQKYMRRAKVPVAWTASARAGTVRYDVRVRQAAPRTGFGRYATWRSGTQATSGAFSSTPGRTLCFSARSRYAAGHVSTWSRERCTAVALDDSALRGSGWRPRSSSRFYAHTLRVSSHRGATLSGARVRVRSVALLVSRRPDGGRVTVRLGTRKLGTVSTAGRRGERVVVPVARLHAVRRGRLTIRVASTGRPVRIDGVFLSAR